MEMSGKGLISRMSDECLMKGKSGSLYFGEYQAGMRKFTLARKSILYQMAFMNVARRIDQYTNSRSINLNAASFIVSL